eukprot:1792426-Rhodomonas_salina.1
MGSGGLEWCRGAWRWRPVYAPPVLLLFIRCPSMLYKLSFDALHATLLWLLCQQHARPRTRAEHCACWGRVMAVLGDSEGGVFLSPPPCALGRRGLRVSASSHSLSQP